MFLVQWRRAVVVSVRVNRWKAWHVRNVGKCAPLFSIRINLAVWRVWCVNWNNNLTSVTCYARVVRHSDFVVWMLNRSLSGSCKGHFSRTGLVKWALPSILLSLPSSKASRIYLASKLLYHSCDNEDAKQIMWVGRKNTERVKWANQMCRVHGSSLSCSSLHGCHVYTAETKLVIFPESSVYRCCCWSKE